MPFQSAPPYAGPPQEEASRLVCHEYFALARPMLHDGTPIDLIAVLQPPMPVSRE